MLTHSASSMCRLTIYEYLKYEARLWGLSWKQFSSSATGNNRFIFTVLTLSSVHELNKFCTLLAILSETSPGKMVPGTSLELSPHTHSKY